MRKEGKRKACKGRSAEYKYGQSQASISRGLAWCPFCYHRNISDDGVAISARIVCRLLHSSMDSHTWTAASGHRRVARRAVNGLGDMGGVRSEDTKVGQMAGFRE